MFLFWIGKQKIWWKAFFPELAQLETLMTILTIEALLANFKLQAFHVKAMRAGFKHYFQQRDYKTIIQVARKVPDTILQEDPKLLMFYDNAVTRAGEE